jgi:L-2-hydroxyglutarate oxidase
MARSDDVDILVVGAGVLGVTIAYWLSALYDCTVAIADREQTAGAHTSSRNTGVIHRPFYLDPKKKRIFARTSDLSYPMWGELAKTAGLPWKPIGTFNVAVEDNEIRTLERYRSWGPENGMDESELELVDGRAVRALEPQVHCRAALLSKTDVSVDFGAFTRYIWRLLLSKGVRFLGGSRVVSVQENKDGVEVGMVGEEASSIRCKFMVNAAGGESLDVAHACGLALEHSVLNFRGEYWVVDEPFALSVSSNIYRPPRYPQFPFLDPHFVVRADGSRQIGPNATLVAGPYVYSGFGVRAIGGLLSPPLSPKLKLMSNGNFVSLLGKEWKSSILKGAMCERVRKFVPGLEARMLNRRAVFGIRSSVVDASGFVPEALVLWGTNSLHIVNYNSPGATGAPSFSALVVTDLRAKGILDGFAERPTDRAPWRLEDALGE